MKKILIFIGIASLVMACSTNELDEMTPEASNVSKTISKPDNEISFVYKGKTYFTAYQKINDSTFVYQNKEVGALLEELDKNESAVYVREDGTMEYYDSFSELSQLKSIPEIETQTQSGEPTLKWSMVMANIEITQAWYNVYVDRLPDGSRWSVQLFRDPQFQGENISFKHTGAHAQLNICNNLGKFNLQHSKKSWNDQPCSLMLSAEAKIVLFRDSEFIVESIVFENNQTNPNVYFKVPDLGNFACSKHRTWRDQASSIYLYLE